MLSHNVFSEKIQHLLISLIMISSTHLKIFGLSLTFLYPAPLSLSLSLSLCGTGRLCPASIIFLSIVIDVPTITFTILIYINIANSRLSPLKTIHTIDPIIPHHATSYHICRNQAIVISCQILPCHSCLIFSYPRTLLLWGLRSYLSYLVFALKYTNKGANYLQNSFFPCFRAWSFVSACLFSIIISTLRSSQNCFRLRFSMEPSCVRSVDGRPCFRCLPELGLCPPCWAFVSLLRSFVSQLWCHVRSQHLCSLLFSPGFAGCVRLVSLHLFLSFCLFLPPALLAVVQSFGHLCLPLWFHPPLNLASIRPQLSTTGPFAFACLSWVGSEDFGSHRFVSPIISLQVSSLLLGSGWAGMGDLGSCAFVAPNYVTSTAYKFYLPFGVFFHVCAFCLGSALVYFSPFICLSQHWWLLFVSFGLCLSFVSFWSSLFAAFILHFSNLPPGLGVVVLIHLSPQFRPCFSPRCCLGGLG